MFQYNILDFVELYCIEGNIGAGKTTLFNNLKNSFISNEWCEYLFIDEPIKTWIEEYNEPTLNKITTPLKCQYENPQQHFHDFQFRVLLSYYNYYKKLEDYILEDKLKSNFNKINKKYVIISDRSPFTMKKIFYDGYKNKHNILLWKQDDYENCYNCFFNGFFTDYNIIYINTNVEQCYINKNLRCREGEKKIKKDFLYELDSLTFQYIINCVNKNIKIIYYNYENDDIEQLMKKL